MLALREEEVGLHPRTLGTLTLVMTLVACGGETSSGRECDTIADQRPTFGRVDIGGYELAWMCEGEGSPTIIAEAG